MLKNERILFIGRNADSVKVLTRISTKARTISIKITAHNGVELIIPKNVSEKKAINFLNSKQDWIIQKTKQIPINTQTSFVEGAKIPIQGKIYTIIHSGTIRGKTRLEEDKLIVCGEIGVLSNRVSAFLKQLAKKEISEIAEIQSRKLGIKFNKITVKDTTSRWGSCSHTKNLAFSWRLIMAPKEVLEYVAAHEVAHLIQMNHSKNFWALVEAIFPSHRSCRKWLKENGAMLHTYG